MSVHKLQEKFLRAFEGDDDEPQVVTARLKALDAQEKQLMQEIRNNVWQQRHYFTFDYHADELINFFKTVIRQSQEKIGREKEILVLPLIA